MNRVKSANEPTIDESRRGLLSAVLFAHLFCLSIAWSANWSRSPLQDRLLSAPGIRQYLRWFNWDSPFVIDFPQTHALEHQDDHRMTIEAPEGTEIEEYPRAGRMWRGGFRAERLRNYLGRFSALAEDNEGEAVSELFRGVAQELLERKPELSATSQRPMVIRFQRLHPPALDAGPAAQAELMEVFVGDVWRDEQGVLRVNKRVAAGDAALVKP